MKYRRKPEIIEAVEFDENHPEAIGDVAIVSKTFTGQFQIYNQKHDSWIGVKTGNMIRIDKAPEDVYPIDGETFQKTYEPINESEA